MSLTQMFTDNILETETRTCPDHGEYRANLVKFGSRKTWDVCPACLQIGIDEERKADDARLRAERNASIVRIAAIPERFMNRDLNNYQAETAEQKHALQVAREYAEDFDAVLRDGRSLIFCGRSGTGKTHLSVGIAKIVMLQGKSAIFTSTMNAIRIIRETYNKNSDITERQAIARFAEPDLMILDEVGSQLGTEAEKVTLFDLINARYEKMRPTIVLSNLNLSGVKEYLGERVFDRLRENGGKQVAFSWNSYRGNKA